MSNKSIAVCCGFPMINTMIWSCAEYFCAKCGANKGILDPDMVELTPQLQAAKNHLQAAFDNVAKDCIAIGMRKRNCPQCADQDHLHHATPEERQKSKAAFDLVTSRQWLKSTKDQKSG